MGKKYKVEGMISVAVETWFHDDEKTGLNEQAYNAIRDAAHISQAYHTKDDDVDAHEINVESVELMGEK